MRRREQFVLNRTTLPLEIVPMKRFFAIAAVLVLTACAPKTEEMPAAAADMAAPAAEMMDSASKMMDSAHVMVDSTMKKADSAVTAVKSKM